MLIRCEYLDSTTYIRSRNSNLLEKNSREDERCYSIAKMPDPNQIYASMFQNTDLRTTLTNSFLIVPNIRDGDGQLIMPYNYRSKLTSESIVIVNAYLKLCVFLLILGTILFIHLRCIETLMMTEIVVIVSFSIQCKCFLSMKYFKFCTIEYFLVLFLSIMRHEC